MPYVLLPVVKLGAYNAVYPWRCTYGFHEQPVMAVLKHSGSFGVCVDCLHQFCARILIAGNRCIKWNSIAIPNYLPSDIVDAVQNYMALIHSIREKKGIT